MSKNSGRLNETPSQTAGPYVHIGLAPGAAGFNIYKQELGWDIVGPNAKGERVRIEGVVIDGDGDTVKDVMLEVWQANAEGIYAHPEHSGNVEPGFRGWGRTIAHFETGEWAFETVKPGAVVDENGAKMAPHINIWIVARGINLGLNTRLYFSDEAEANATDPIINLIEPEERSNTLIAERSDRDGTAVYRFDVRLQGEYETVFLDI